MTIARLGQDRATVRVLTGNAPWQGVIEIATRKPKGARDGLDAVGLGRRVLHGMAWMLAQNVAARACSLLSQLALAALLLPADFGVIGLAYTVTSVASVLVNVGIDEVAMQRQRALRLWIGPVFWMTFGLAMVAATLVLVVAPAAAAAYGAPDIVGLLAVLALSMPIGALASAPGVLMRARMQFSFIAAYGTLEIVAQAALTVGLAWAGFGAYSFVLPTPVLAAVKAVVWWRVAGTRARFRPQVGRWRYVAGNTAVVFVTRSLVALVGQGDYIVLGLLASQDVVGVYYFGFRLAAQPLWMLAGNFSNVLLPALVQLNPEPARQMKAALDASVLLSFCVMPLAMLQTAVAAPLIVSLFGEKWATAVPVIQLLSVGLAFDAVSWVAGTLLSARGDFRTVFVYALAQTPLFFALVVAGAVLDGAVGVAWCVFGFYVVTQPFFVIRTYERLGSTLREGLAIYAKPLALSAAAVGGAMLASSLAARPLNRVLIILALGGAFYAMLVHWLAPEVWHGMRDRLISNSKCLPLAMSSHRDLGCDVGGRF